MDGVGLRGVLVFGASYSTQGLEHDELATLALDAQMISFASI